MHKAVSHITLTDQISNQTTDLNKISPSDFEEFLPWACMQYNVDVVLQVTKKAQEIYMPKTGFSKHKLKHPQKNNVPQIHYMSNSKLDKDIKSTSSVEALDEARTINVVTTYQGINLIHVKFEQGKRLPRELLAIITLIAEFHPFLQGITIKCGIDKYTVYELCKLIELAHITEIYLDDTFVKEANYDLLLKEPSQLQVLSLARCRLGDKVFREIAAKLHYPLPASKKLSVLNVPSNRLTNNSAKYIAEALRTNRQLSYLNIASNMITDAGGQAILKSLMEFPITEEEQLALKHKYLEYSKAKKAWIDSHMTETKATVGKKEKPAKKTLVESVSSKGKTVPSIKNDFNDKATDSIEKDFGAFVHPLSDGPIINEWRYCKGNNTLAYLNISYNSLSHPFLQSLVDVLEYQHSGSRRPRGLVNVRLEGNLFPVDCTELERLNEYLENGLLRNQLESKIMKSTAQESKKTKK